MDLFDRLKGLGDRRGDKGREGQPDRRFSKRVKLPVQVQLKIGGAEFQPGRLIDVSLVGLCIETGESAPTGAAAVVRFEGYPEVCEPFLLHGHVARSLEGEPGGAGIEIDRAATAPDALQQYRELILHYLHHRPLLDDMRRGYLEARCPACGWIGRVGARSMTCSRCGERVTPVDGQES